MTALIPQPPRIDLCEITTDQTGKLRAKITRPWSMYFDALLARVGGNVAPLAVDAVALGVFGRRVQPVQEPADVRYVGTFLPRVTPTVQAPEDANSVLCGRVFARR
jgi:hypothetical protein